MVQAASSKHAGTSMTCDSSLYYAILVCACHWTQAGATLPPFFSLAFASRVSCIIAAMCTAALAMHIVLMRRCPTHPRVASNSKYQ